MVVADDSLATDDLQQEIMSLAIPQTIESIFVSIEGLATEISRLHSENNSSSILVLFASCPDAKRAFDYGFGFDSLNIGNVHYAPGKKQISPSVALSDDDESCLKQLSKKGVKLDFRCVPNDPVQVRF